VSSPNIGHPRSMRANERSTSFTEVMSSFTDQEPAIQEHDLAGTTFDPANMWSDSTTTPNTPRRHDSVCTSLPTLEPLHSNLRLPFDTPQYRTKESASTSRARYAANQRHSKALKPKRDSKQASSANEADMKAEEQKQRLREKNKVAAAKCRQRQKKQFETVQAKGGHLGGRNAQLKSCVQELRQELIVLRGFALNHADCGCQIAQYNRVQADRVIAEYYSSYSGHSSTAMSEKSAGLQS
jgi:hypothetical protein